MSLINDLKIEALNLGFHFFGVTTPEPLSSFPVFQEWVAEKRYAGMTYLAAENALESRADPATLLPGCQSILMVGMAYPPPFRPREPSPGKPTGRLSSYAWGVDYHRVIPPRLEQLILVLQKITGKNIASRIYCDTGPVLEKALAQRAGLGWIGRNGCLINPKAGSFFFLGVALLDIELDISLPFTADRCGNCTRCIDSCPTGCILPNRTIDACRCISYLTIENKGSIPPDLRSRLGDRIFGCDACQQVCPWNQKADPPQPDPEFHPLLLSIDPILEEEILLSESEFKQKYQASPILRAKRKGYLRNVAVAFGNQKEPSTVPVLIRVLLDEKESLIRSHTAWALGQINDAAAHRGLQQAKQLETSPEVLEEINSALATE